MSGPSRSFRGFCVRVCLCVTRPHGGSFLLGFGLTVMQWWRAVRFSEHARDKRPVDWTHLEGGFFVFTAKGIEVPTSLPLLRFHGLKRLA